MAQMRKIIVTLAVITFCSLAVRAQQTKQEKSDPCSKLRFMPLLNEAPTISATDVRNLPQCFHGKFIRLVGIYRVAFENSDLYDPTGEGGATWISFDPFYSAVKRCSAPQALKLLDREKGEHLVLSQWASSMDRNLTGILILICQPPSGSDSKERLEVMDT
jgi:hypothetical protein